MTDTECAYFAARKGANVGFASSRITLINQGHPSGKANSQHSEALITRTANSRRIASATTTMTTGERKMRCSSGRETIPVESIARREDARSRPMGALSLDAKPSVLELRRGAEKHC